jgi:hypothetical protein
LAKTIFSNVRVGRVDLAVAQRNLAEQSFVQFWNAEGHELDLVPGGLLPVCDDASGRPLRQHTLVNRMREDRQRRLGHGGHNAGHHQSQRQRRPDEQVLRLHLSSSL